MDRIHGFLAIVRPVNSVMIGVAVIIGVLIAGGYGRVGASELILSWLTGFTLTGAAMVINDYFDREIDAINEPGRPIPSGAVKPGEAVAYSLLLGLVGLVAAFRTGSGVFAVALFSWVLMMAYSAWGKKMGFVGNLMVSTCIAVPFVYGGILSGRVESSLLFSLLAFLTNTGREVTKGIVDQEGDLAREVMTVAVRYGAGAASIVASAFFAAAVLASAMPVVFSLVSLWYVPFVAVTDLGLLYCVIQLLRNPDREVARKVKNQILVWMIFGLLAFAAGSLIK
jgi:geranylgeranylglycerol-phosphate geranylgeranyltransferase